MRSRMISGRIQILALIMACAFPALGQETSFIHSFNHDKSKADVSKVILEWLEQNHKAYNLLAPRQASAFKIFLFGNHDCSTMFQAEMASYFLDVILGHQSAEFRFRIKPFEGRMPSPRCLASLRDKWKEVSRQLESQVHYVKKTDPVEVPPDIKPGHGFQKVPFGVDVKSATRLLELDGFVPGTAEIFGDPASFESHYFASDRTEEPYIALSLRIGDPVAMILLNFDLEGRFYSFHVMFPARKLDDVSLVCSRDCPALAKAFERQFGPPGESPVLEPQALSADGHSKCADWNDQAFTAYAAVSPGTGEYYAVGVVRNKRLFQEMKEARKKKAQADAEK